MSCEMEVKGKSLSIKEPEYSDIDGDFQESGDERLWSILIYMAADNNLEAAAIEDLCELESSKINSNKVSLFALIDRNPNYDSSNDNWTGSRMYKISTGNAAGSKVIKSTEISCENIGLIAGQNSELDMSSTYVLSGALEYIMSRYPAENYALIVWGHGTGWRSQNQSEEFDQGLFKGFCSDASSDCIMTLYQFSDALKTALGQRKLDFLGFDTCYGGEIEILYQLRDSAQYLAGSEGLIAFSGWDYKYLFDYFEDQGIYSRESLAQSTVEQFKEKYAYTNRASIIVSDQSYVSDYTETFNEFSAFVANKISNLEIQQEVFDILYSGKPCTTEKYTYGKENYDVYLDVSSMIENLNDYFTKSGNLSQSEKNELKVLYEKFIELDKKIFLESWASDREKGGAGVYFSTLSANGLLATSHPEAYISDSTYYQIDFVKDCKGYVPLKNTGESLLDKLFYTQF
ncbi:MAG: hypothetical protein K5866_06670 [Treponema sp.]|nr:hypothetical protein [Treponema sp.]